MSLFMYKLAAALAILLTSLLAIIYPLRIRAKPDHHVLLELADAFASGIFLGAALFHLLPEAIHAFSHYATTPYPVAEAFCAAGFLILLFLERLSERSSHGTHGLPLMLAGILIIHALVEGLALGITSQTATTSILFLAILAHKGSESFALAVILNRSQLALSYIIGIAGLFACMTPMGIGLGAYLFANGGWHHHSPLLIAAFQAFAAGTFLYMSTLHHINHHHQHHSSESLKELWFLMAGLLVMAGLAFF